MCVYNCAVLLFQTQAGHYFLFLSCTTGNAAVPSITSKKMKSTSVVIRIRCLDKRQESDPEHRAPKPSSCFLSKHISSPPRSEQEKNICDPVLTHHNVTLTHGIRELLLGSLSVSLCNQSRRHCPKSRGVTFCCRAEFKAERQTGRPASLPEPEREIRAPTATFYSLKKSLSKA